MRWGAAQTPLASLDSTWSTSFRFRQGHLPPSSTLPKPSQIGACPSRTVGGTGPPSSLYFPAAGSGIQMPVLGEDQADAFQGLQHAQREVMQQGEGQQ